MIKVLAHIREESLKLAAPPIKGVAPESVRWYLGNATRCYLYGLYGACVALCRACLEDALTSVLTARGFNEWKLSDKIARATKEGVLGGDGKKMANSVKDLGDGVMHRQLVPDKDTSRDALDQARKVVEDLFPVAEPTGAP